VNSVRFHAEARAELVHEVGFYTDVRRSLGERFDKAVKAAVEQAAEFPDLGSPFLYGTRRVIPKKFHFSIVYLTLGNEIFIVAIAPDSRRPGYWRGRMGDVSPKKHPSSV
jgi:plasmid stabilization system protein ParE